MEQSILEMLAGLGPSVTAVLEWLGLAMVVAQAVVVMTPTKKDDTVMGKLLGLPIIGGLISKLKNFAPIQKKK